MMEEHAVLENSVRSNLLKHAMGIGVTVGPNDGMIVGAGVGVCVGRLVGRGDGSVVGSTAAPGDARKHALTSTATQPLKTFHELARETRLDGVWRPRRSSTRDGTSIEEMGVLCTVIELAPSSPIMRQSLRT